MIRNLAFFCYPRKCGMWRRSVNHLLRNWPIFTGRKVITIAIDECCDDPRAVMAEFQHSGRPESLYEIEFLVRENVPVLQETAHFLPMLERLESLEPDEFTTYAHAKGSTHANPEAASHLWCDAMAAANLEYPELVECALSRANIVGAFRSHGLWSFPGYHNWHFAGTWFTFRHSATFSRDWRNIHPNFMGVEAWPGIFPVAESGCLFYDSANTAHLYDREFLRQNITPSLYWWRKSLEKCGLSPIGRNSLASREPLAVS